jgi:hypothetical protein
MSETTVIQSVANFYYRLAREKDEPHFWQAAQVIETLERERDEARNSISDTVNHADMMRDEFKRIAACPGADDEIRGLCQRAIEGTNRRVPVLVELDATQAERDRLRRYAEGRTKALCEVTSALEALFALVNGESPSLLEGDHHYEMCEKAIALGNAALEQFEIDQESALGRVSPAKGTRAESPACGVSEDTSTPLSHADSQFPISSQSPQPTAEERAEMDALTQYHKPKEGLPVPRFAGCMDTCLAGGCTDYCTRTLEIAQCNLRLRAQEARNPTRSTDIVATLRHWADGPLGPMLRANLLQAADEIDAYRRQELSRLYPQPLVNVTDDGDLCIEWWKGDRKVTCYAKPDYPLIFVDERGPGETSRKIGEALDWLNEERHHAYPQSRRCDECGAGRGMCMHPGNGESPQTVRSSEAGPECQHGKSGFCTVCHQTGSSS